jgi:hypothetical protein
MKIFKLLGLLAALGLGASAAQAADGKFAFGPQGGLVYTNYSASNLPSGSQLDDENGYMAGIFFEMGLWTVTFRPEINYVVKKYTITSRAEVANNYLEIPLLLKVNPFGEFVVSPFIVLGPSWSTRLSSDVKLLGTTTSFNNTNDDWDLAGVAGAGVEFNVAESLGLNVQGRYNFGLRDTDSSTQELKSRGLYALTGLSTQF